MLWLIESLRHHPEIALFLVLALGYAIGELRLGSFKIGHVLGVLIAGIAVGQFNIPVSDALENTFFMLFLFATGYRTGPQFFRSLRATGLKQIVLTFFVCVTACAISLTMSRLSGLDAGKSAGLFAGALSSSTAFGAASGAVARLDVSDATRHMLLARSAVSFAVCYLIGVVLVTWFLAKVGPRLMRVDLAKSCSEREQEMGVPQDKPGVSSANGPFAIRGYVVPFRLNGRTVLDLEAGFNGYRVFVERRFRDGEIVTPSPNELLFAGDRVALWGRREALIGPVNTLSENEIHDTRLLDLGIISLDMVVTRQEPEQTLGDLINDEASRGVFLLKIVRAGDELPFTLHTSIEPGDVLSVTGEKSHVDRLVGKLGYSQIPTNATNMTLVSAAIFLGAMIGLPALVFNGIEVSLTLFVGVLLGGLFSGWLSSRYPKFGGIPAPALWLFDSLGLAGFLALAGLEAGPGFVNG